jgi:Tol biopolymer transport system component
MTTPGATGILPVLLWTHRRDVSRTRRNRYGVPRISRALATTIRFTGEEMSMWFSMLQFGTAALVLLGTGCWKAPEQTAAGSIRVHRLDPQQPGARITLPGYPYLGSPVFSHDGQSIAFDAYKADTRKAEVWIVGRDGTEPRKLVDGATPRWSPDGKKLLFMRENPADAKQDRGIFVVNRDGTGERRIGPGRWPDWSPDGQQIAFSLSDEPGTGARTGSRVYVAKPDGSDRREIAEGDCPSWSPDGKKLACCHRDPAFPLPLIRVVELETGREAFVGYGRWRANWSPDGKSLVANGVLGRSKVGMVKLSAEKPGKPEAILPDFPTAESPCYSPDGKYLVFVVNRAATD